jgi:hypothetical protein
MRSARVANLGHQGILEPGTLLGRGSALTLRRKAGAVLTCRRPRLSL